MEKSFTEDKKLEIRKPPSETNRAKKFLFIVFFIFLTLSLGITSYFVYELWLGRGSVEPIPQRETKEAKEKKAVTPSSKTEEYEIRASDVLYSLPLGFRLAIDKNWDVKILQADRRRNFLIANLGKDARIEIEAISHSQEKWQSYIKRPFVTIESIKTKKINGRDVVVQEGKETFARSQRKVVNGSWETNGNTLTVYVYSPDFARAKSLFDYLSKSISFEKETVSLIPEFVSSVYAYATDSPPNLPQIEYKLVEVMGESFVDEITRKDPPYKDGFVRGYRFLAFKSQRLATYAMEDRTSNPSSFIHSQLFNSGGEEISSEMDTHIEFQVPHTGEYFFLVYSFNQQEGKIEIRIDDHDQLECKGFVKYPDSEELFDDPENPNNIYKGASEIAIGYQCPAPIELIDEYTVRYQHPMPRRQGEPPQVITSAATQAIISSHADYLVKPKEGKETSFKLFVDGNYENTTIVDILIQQVNANQILITPVEGLFPKNHQIETRPWTHRVFTQDKLQAPNLSTLNNIILDFEDDFTEPQGRYGYDPIRAEYFEWIKEDTSSTELLGGVIQYRKSGESAKSGDDLEEEFKNYFLKQEYIISEANSFKGIPTSDAIPSPKNVVGLKKGETVCKLINSTAKRFAIYCAQLTE